MPVIDVGTIESQHLSKLAHESSSRSFDAKDLEDLDEGVAVGPCRVNTWNSKDIS